MAILIEMERPDNCLKCPISNGPKAWTCAFTGKEIPQKDPFIAEGCPLKPGPMKSNMPVLSKEHICNMQSGRELDALVAEKVMGIDPTSFYWLSGELWHGHAWERNVVPYYSTKIEDAWHITKKTEDIFIRVANEADENKRTIVHVFVGETNYTYKALSAPEAICKAALLAWVGTEGASESEQTAHS